MANAGGLRDVDRPATPESTAFREWFRERAERAQAADWSQLLDYRRKAPHAALMHPSDEHLLPWYVAAGVGGGGPARDAGGEGTPARRIHASLTYGDLGMDAYAFGPQAARLAEVLPG